MEDINIMERIGDYDLYVIDENGNECFYEAFTWFQDDNKFYSVFTGKEL